MINHESDTLALDAESDPESESESDSESDSEQPAPTQLSCLASAGNVASISAWTKRTRSHPSTIAAPTVPKLVKVYRFLPVDFCSSFGTPFQSACIKGLSKVSDHGVNSLKINGLIS